MGKPTTVKRPKKEEQETKIDKFDLFWKVSLSFSGAVLVAAVLTHFVVYSKIDAQKYDLGVPISLDGVLRPNNKLADAELLLYDQIYGPETIAINTTTQLAYTGLKTGLICEIDLSSNPPKILRAVRLTSIEDCDGSYQTMSKCGRPLSMRLNPYGELLVVDAYLGFFAIDWNAEKVRKVFGAGELMSNDETAPPVRYLNDFDLLPDGRLVFSESSTRFDDRDFLLDVLEHKPNGRLLIYDPTKKELKVLKKNLYFPNGVQVSLEPGTTPKDDMRVFYAEMGMTRINAIWVPTDKFSKKKPTNRVFIPNLPGYPDNIRLTTNGKLLIPIASKRSASDSFFETRPKLREFLTKIFNIRLLDLVTRSLSESSALVIKVDPNTREILDSYHDPTGTVSEVSCAVDDGKGNLLLGSDSGYFIARKNI